MNVKEQSSPISTLDKRKSTKGDSTELVQTTFEIKNNDCVPDTFNNERQQEDPKPEEINPASVLLNEIKNNDQQPDPKRNLSDDDQNSAELLKNLKTSNIVFPKTKEEPSSNTTENSTPKEPFKPTDQFPTPTIIYFKTQIPQEPPHRRKMRLFPKVRCYSKFEGIFKKINYYNITDHSEIFDLKVEHLIKGFRKECKNRQDVLVVLRLIFNHCLHNNRFAYNVAPFFCCMRFYQFHLHGVHVTRKFFVKMQYAFLESRSIRLENRKAFRNAITFTGNCYNRLMLLFTNPYHLENYLIEYLQMLLESPEDKDFKMFTVEVYRNGKNLCKKYWIKMSHLFLQLRNFQVNYTTISFKAKVWIMLALDLYTHSYDLPDDLVNFYREFLENEIFALVRMPETTLHQYSIPIEDCETDPEDLLEI